MNCALGLWIAPDRSVDINGGINTYAYVGGNPISYFDPDGLQQMPTSGRLPGLSPRTNGSFCATAECAAGIPQGRARLPESLRPTEGLQCTARAGVGAFGVSATGNASFGGSNASISPGIGTVGGSAGITIGVSCP